MICLSCRQVVSLHDDLIEQFGGSPGIRDEGLLDSALSAPFQTFADQELYPNLIEKAAAVCWGIVRNHPFVDGNKRTGAHVMLVFLELNGYSLRYSQDELISLILDLAAGKIQRNDLVQWLRSRLL